MCGDWNTRVGNLHHTIGETEIPRKSLDTKVNKRASWVIETCEQQGWFILNGLEPGPPARCTFARGEGQSCIDLIFANEATQTIAHDPDTMRGLSDHILVTITMRIPYTSAPYPRKNTNGSAANPKIIYKWVGGSDVTQYTKST